MRTQLPDLPLLLRELSRLELLFRRCQVGSQTTYQLVLPAELRDTVLTSLHDHMGHMGADRTLDLVRTRFYWPKIAMDVERKVRTCGRCMRRKARPEKAAPLVNIRTTRPLELLCVDYLSLEADKSGVKDILVITDHFTKFVVAIPTPNQKARTVAKCLWENFMVNYGIPEKLHCDQGPDFESRTIKELCRVAGVHKVWTTPYHPRGNPVKRFIRTLLDMLGTLQNQEKSRWRDHVRPLVHAYNCTKNEVTGFTPYELMFGHQPRLPVDLAFKLPVQEIQHSSHSENVRNLKESYRIAMEKAAKIAHKNKTTYDRHVTASDLEPGDRVLVRNVRIRGKQLSAEKSTELLQTSMPRRPRTRANPVVEEEDASDEDDNPIIPVWLTFPMQSDLTMTNIQDIQDTQSPGINPVESCVKAQNNVNSPDYDNLPDLDNQPSFDSEPDVCNETSNGPLMVNSDQNNIEYLPAEEVTLTKQKDETALTQEHSPEDDCPDVHTEQLSVPTNVTDETKGSDGQERTEPEERKDHEGEMEGRDDTVPVDGEENVDTNESLRRSERNRRPPQRLDYAELGKPLITAVKSFFQGPQLGLTL